MYKHGSFLNLTYRHVSCVIWKHFCTLFLSFFILFSNITYFTIIRTANNCYWLLITGTGWYHTNRPTHCDHFLIYCAPHVSISFNHFWFIYPCSLVNNIRVVSSESILERGMDSLLSYRTETDDGLPKPAIQSATAPVAPKLNVIAQSDRELWSATSENVSLYLPQNASLLGAHTQ
jgi:hypothetical protein